MSEQNGRKPDSIEPPPASDRARPASVRAASVWGAARDSLAAVRNLDALLRSTVPYGTIHDLLPELRTSAGVLRDVFARAAALESSSEAALTEVGRYGEDRVDDFDALLGGVATSDGARAELAQRARTLADELEAAADLLATLERAAAPVITELSVVRIAHETGRMSGASGRGRVLVVRLEQAGRDCSVPGDPYLVGSLLALATAYVGAEGLGPLTLRARCEPPLASFVVEASVPSDARLPTIPVRVMEKVPPTELAIRRLAEQVGASLELGGGRATIRLREAVG